MKGKPTNITAATMVTVAVAVEEKPPAPAHEGNNNLGAPSTSRGPSRDTDVDGGSVGKEGVRGGGDEGEKPVSVIPPPTAVAVVIVIVVVCGDVVASAAAPLIVMAVVGAPVRNSMASRLSMMMADGEGWTLGKKKAL